MGFYKKSLDYSGLHHQDSVSDEVRNKVGETDKTKDGFGYWQHFNFLQQTGNLPAGYRGYSYAGVF